MITRTHKVCGTCRRDKPLSAFHRSSQHGDGYKTACKDCRNTESKRRYLVDASSHRTKMKDRYLRHRAILRVAKAKPCVRCGQSFPPPAMHFHHRDPSTKIIPVAKLIGYSESMLQAEIDKCDVMCANCHAIITWSEEDWAFK